MSNEMFEQALEQLCSERFVGEHKQFACDDFKRVSRRVVAEFCESKRVMSKLFKQSYTRDYLNGWQTGAGWAVAQEFQEFDVMPWDIEGLFTAAEEGGAA